jgi:hypothetical protein
MELAAAIIVLDNLSFKSNIYFGGSCVMPWFEATTGTTLDGALTMKLCDQVLAGMSKGVGAKWCRIDG